MRCNICGKEITDYGNNPFPICGQEDTESRCCNDCNSIHVIRARLLLGHRKDKTPKIDDTVVIFYSKNSDEPTNIIRDTGKFLSGTITDNEALPEGCFEGTWGNFILNTKTDSYMIIED